MGLTSSLGLLLACSLFAQLLPCSTMSNSLSHSHYSLENSCQGPDSSIRTSSQPERVRHGGRVAFADTQAAASAKAGGFERNDIRMEDLAFVGAMPLPTTFPLTAPTISGVSAPAPSGVWAGQGWVWAVGADGPQLVRGNGTALSAYSLYGPQLASLKNKRAGAEALAGWAGAAGQPSAASEWPRMQLGHARKTYKAGTMGLGLEEQMKAGARLLLSPSTSTASSLRGEMVAKLRGLSGRFELANGHPAEPVNLLLRQRPAQAPCQPDLMDESEEAEVEAKAEAEAEEGGGQWHAGAVRAGPLVQPSSDAWLEEHNNADRSLLPHVASLLASAAEAGDEEEEEAGVGVGGEKSAFDAQRRPKVPLGEYCERMLKYGACSPGCLAVAVVYVDRFLARSPSLKVSGLNVHRLLLGAVLLATKQWDDAHYNNAFWAKVGGVSTEELNGLERTLLAGMRWQLHVDKPQFDLYRQALTHWPATAEAAVERLREGAGAGALRSSRVMAAAEKGLAASKGRSAAVRLKREEAPGPPTPAPDPLAGQPPAAAASPAIAA